MPFITPACLIVMVELDTFGFGGTAHSPSPRKNCVESFGSLGASPLLAQVTTPYVVSGGIAHIPS